MKQKRIYWEKIKWKNCERKRKKNPIEEYGMK